MEGEEKKRIDREQRKAAKQLKVQKAQNKKSWEQNPTKQKKTTFRLKKEYINTTPEGEKKDLSQPMSSSYDPPAVEAAWYSWWEKKKFFNPDYVSPGCTAKDNDKREKFVIVIPPPNVTGSLHIGHALTNSIEDAICRWHRMCGRKVLWVPGTDHAGIATQTVVERKLWAQEKKTKYDYGRDVFVEKVWEWKKVYGNRITTQLRRLGSSLDWERECFTMDDKLSKAVIEAFVCFYESGLIYRANRLVNWSCSLRTAISDLECDDLELGGLTKMPIPGYDEKRKYTFGLIWEFSYPVISNGESKEYITVATTRPETMLGDTAVAVHPDDIRYKHLHNKFVQHPFVDRKIPIICDPILVDMSFGTGAVKVTPGHDPNDYETGLRHNLEFINILNDDGTMNNTCGEFTGMKRFDCREKILKRLGELGLYKGIHKENKMRLKQCNRSSDIIEPIMKPQWWVNMDKLAQISVDAVKTEKLKIIPEAKTKQWYQFLENIQPWCISRQLWWGHQIPAWMVLKNGQKLEDIDTSIPDIWIIARNEEDALLKAKNKYPNEEFNLVRDSDVLDTWFSSGLFPFSVFGWPNTTSDLSRFYPTSLLETGYDILFFWVARMVMMGIQLTGTLPFNTVLLHSMVRDAHGRKMSKSTGNVIDPIDVIEGITLEGLHETLEKGNLAPGEIIKAKEGQKKDFPNGISECGTDALRFALCAYCQQGKDINLDIKRVESYRNFCNKIWNATILAWMFLGDNYTPPASSDPSGKEGLMDKWILHRLNVAVTEANNLFEKFEFGAVTTAIYDFWLYETCDVYLEVIKPIMNAKENVNLEAQKAIRDTLYTCLDEGYRLLSPFMPFITEELWQRLPRRSGDLTESICVAEYPIPRKSRQFPEIDNEVSTIQKMVKVVRALQTTYNIPKSQKQCATINVHDNTHKEMLERYKSVFETLSYVGNLSITLNEQPPKGCATDIPDRHSEVFLHIKGLVDIDKELTKLNSKLEATNKQLQSILKRVNSSDYSRVPDNVKEKDQEKISNLQIEIGSLQKTINTFTSIQKE